MDQARANNVRLLDILGSAFLVICVAVFTIGIVQLKTNTEDVSRWLPDNSPDRARYEFFQSYFGSDDFLVVTWEGCEVHDTRISVFTDWINEHNQHQLIKSVRSGPDIVRDLIDNARLTKNTAINRLKGFLFGLSDPKLTCVVMELTEKGTENRPQVIALTWQGVDATPNLERQSVSLGGYPFVATHLDQQIKRSFLVLLVPSFLVATLVALFCLRNVGLTFILFVASSVAAGVSVAFMPLCGAKFGGLASIIPTLAFVLTTSGSLHLIRYNLDSIGDPFKLLSIGWKPCVISTATTAIGMLSLMRSEFPAIRDFGFFCAAGVGFSLASQLLLVPWLLHRFGRSGLEKIAAQNEDSSFWSRFLAGTRRKHVLIVLVSLVLTIVSAIGLTSLKARVEVESLFSTDSPIMVSVRSLEKRLGPMDQTEAILIFDDVDPKTFYQRAEFVRGLQAEWLKVKEIQVAHSLLNYLPRQSKKDTARAVAQRVMFRRKLTQYRDRLAEGMFLKIDGDKEIWRITLRFPFSEAVDFELIQAAVVDKTKKYCETFEAEGANFTNPELVYTGKLHLFQQAQKMLLNDLYKNFLLAFVIITPLLIIVLRSVSIGLIAMIPNVMPTLIVFGGLGLLGIRVDIAIAMTASVALGIAVDDTSHFLIRFRDFGGTLSGVLPPLRQSIDQCGPAMFHTTLISGLSILVSYFSELLVMSKFALTISILLTIALLADLIMLPAILFLANRFLNSPELPKESGKPELQ